MKDIKLLKKNDSEVEVWTSEEISREFTLRYSARPTGYEFMPAYRQGIWDGWVRFYKSNSIPIGLVDDVKEFAKEKGYSIEVDFDDTLGLDKNDFIEFINCLGLPPQFELRDYQVDAAFDCINEKRLSVKANTAAGKSLILYYIVRFMALEGKKALIIVPSTSLVEQLYKDWKEYGWNDIDQHITKIYSGQFKKYDSPITIITWQSMIKDLKVLKQFDAVMIDEAHGAKSKSITTICKQCVNAQWRLGFSGTFPQKNTVEWFGIVGNLGAIRQYTTYKSLNEAGRVSDLKIHNLFLNWGKEVCRVNIIKNYKDYQGENKFIEGLPRRRKFITSMAQNLKGNTIVLFTHVDYGKVLFNMMDESKKCYYISGEIKTDQRELIRSRMERGEDIVLFASFGTFAQGINIKNLHNIVMSSNYKSLNKVVQSIGRSIRVHESKETATIYNFIDDLRYEKSGETYVNYSILHHRERLKIYKTEGYDNVENHRIKLFS